MTSAWNTKSRSFNFIGNQFKLSPPPFGPVADNTGRTSVVSDPGYSSAANSVSAEYHDKEFLYFDEEVSPHNAFNYQQEFGQSAMSQLPEYHINASQGTNAYQGQFVSRKPINGINTNSGYCERNKFLEYNQRNAIRRNRSTSEIDSHRYYSQSTHAAYDSLLMSQDPNNMAIFHHDKQQQVADIPTISVDEYLFNNENVFFNDMSASNVALSSAARKTTLEEEDLHHPNSLSRSTSHTNNQYLIPHQSPGVRGGSRLPSTDSLYEGNMSTASSPCHQPQFSPVSLESMNIASSQLSSNLYGINNNSTVAEQQIQYFPPCKETSMTSSNNSKQNGEDMWKGYVERTLPTVPAPPIGDNGNTADLATLYDYYKVPQEKRFQTCQLLTGDNNEMNSVPAANTSASAHPVSIAQGIQSSIVTSSLHKNLHQKTHSYQKLSDQNFHQMLDSASPATKPLNQTANNVISVGQGEFEYVMEAPKSLKQKENEPTMSYINKGQFYCITLKRNQQDQTNSTKVRSVVQVVFGDGKPEEEQLRHWKYWHARQHTAKQRIIDIADYKDSNMVFDVEEIAHNAIAFSWDSREEARIYISCNCLSTDFSAQKGIKGLPLLLQVDTYPNESSSIAKMHRGVCQIKVFCDKGAERKIRDEERKSMKKSQKKQGLINTTAKSFLPNTSSSSNSKTNQSSTPQNATQKKLDNVYFKNVDDLTPPTYFIPEISAHSLSTSSHTPAISPNKSNYQDNELFPIHVIKDTIFSSNRLLTICNFQRENSLKRCHSEMEFVGETTPKMSKIDLSRSVLLYVRSDNEEIYDGLMLPTPDIRGLKAAIEEKYLYPASNITKLLKRCKKGITVNLDDNIIEHYCNEDTFTIAFRTEITAAGKKSYCVTLTEI